MIEFCMHDKIDAVMLNETNRKCTKRTTHVMSSKMKDQEDKQGVTMQKVKRIKKDLDWHQGGLMNVIIGKISSLIQHQQGEIDKFRQIDGSESVK